MTYEETKKLLEGCAAALDVGLNGGRKEKDMGFVLLVFPFGEAGGEAHCMSNADLGDIPAVFESFLKSQLNMIRDKENNSRRPN